ncbi:PAS domain-containing protein [Streptomyces angustmyceticus]|uniref:PAS domain-containing protein n=1 Tax=Streptomyces angustmyceticus TaxID=285578 RepID=UPI00344F3838
MERGPSNGDDLTLAAPVPRDAVPARIPLAVVVVGADGRISHWSSGAHRLFGPTPGEAVGAPAVDLMPVTGALGDKGWGGRTGGPEAGNGYEEPNGPGREGAWGGGACPTAGRARMAAAGAGPVDLLWWAYPLVGSGAGRVLVLAVAADRLPGEGATGHGARHERFAPAFGPHTEVPGAADLARRLPEILPSIGPQESARIVARILELGCPVLEVSLQERFPVTLD